MMRFRLRKNKTSRLLVILLVSLGCITSVPAQKDGKNNHTNQLVNKQKKIKEEIREINEILQVTKSNKKSSIGRLVNINMKLEKRQELILTISQQISQINRDIKNNENQIGALTGNLEKLKKEYARMIVFAQRNQDAYSVLMFIFAAESFSQAYSRLKYVQQYSEFRKKQALEIIETQTRLLAKLNELRQQRREKNSLLGIEEDEKKTLSSEKEEQEQVLTELQKKEKELKAELEKKKQETIQLQAEIRRQIELEMKRKAEEAAEEARLLAKKEKEREAKEREEREAKKRDDKKRPLPPVAKAVEKPAPEKPLPDATELSEAAVALSADFSNNRGKLPWPIPKGIICEGYGEHEHPAIKGFMMFNNGLEICSAKGSQARAVFAGEVTSIAISPTGGKLVIIRHGEYLSVYCNLEHILVKTGDKVSVKQPIATVMYDEEEGKSSMNFQIWKGQKTMDPGGWLLNAR
jgi:septal ring factor EnvC (AmiA/AmiB activator)